MIAFFCKSLFTIVSKSVAMLLLLIYLNGCSQATLPKISQSDTDKSTTNGAVLEPVIAKVNCV